MQRISTESAPKAIGPYSQAIVIDNLIFCSGQIPLDPETEVIVAGGIKEQARQVIKNLRAVLQAAGAGLEDVVKTDVFLAHIEDFVAMNDVYSGNFTSEPYPARATVEVSCLPKNALIEIACIARKKH